MNASLMQPIQSPSNFGVSTNKERTYSLSAHSALSQLFNVDSNSYDLSEDDSLNLTEEEILKKIELDNVLKPFRIVARNPISSKIFDFLNFFKLAIWRVCPSFSKYGVSHAIINIGTEAKSSLMEKEYHLLQRIKHPHIIKAFEWIPTMNILVTEFYEKGNLEDYLVNISQVISWEYRISFAQQICNAVSYLHDKEIIHYNLCLRNILLDEKLNIHLSNFQTAIKNDIIPGDISFASLEPNSLHPEFLYKEEIEVPASRISRRKIIDIRCFGIILFQLLFYGQEVMNCYSEEKILNPIFPEWCLSIYKTMTLFCLYPKMNSPDYLNLHLIKSGFTAIRSELNLTATCLIEEEEVDSGFEYKKIPPVQLWINELKLASDPIIRKNILKNLVKFEINGKEDLELITFIMCNDMDHSIRKQACQVLGKQDLRNYPEMIHLLITSFQNDPNIDVRISAAESLGKQDLTNYPEAINVLISALTNGSNTPAIIALGKQELISHPHAMETLIYIAQYDLNPEIRSHAIEALGNQKLDYYKRALPVLVSALKTDKNPLVRMSAAESLAKQNLSEHNEIIDSLILCIQKEAIWEVRLSTIKALGNQNLKGQSDANNVLLKTLKSDEHPLVRSKAAFALINQDIRHHSEIIRALVRSLLYDPDDTVKLHAAEALGTKRLKLDAVESLVKALKTCEDWEVRNTIAKALSKQRVLPRIAIKALAKAIQGDEHKEVQISSATALIKHDLSPYPDIIEFLIKTLATSNKQELVSVVGEVIENQDFLLVLQIAQSMYVECSDSLYQDKLTRNPQLIDENKKASLVQLIRINSNADVITKAIEVLGKHDLSHNEQAIEALCEVIEYHSDSWSRGNSIEALGNQKLEKFPKAMEVLIETLKKDEIPQIRSKIAEALGKQNLNLYKNSFHILLNVLQRDADRYVRQKAALALGKQDLTENYQVIQAMITILNEDPYEDIRNTIIQAFMEQDLSKYPSILTALLKIQKDDQNQSVRINALKCIAKIDFANYPEILETLLNLLKDRNQDSFIQIAVLEALGEHQHDFSYNKRAIESFLVTLKKGMVHFQQTWKKKMNPFKNLRRNKEDFHWGVRKEAAKTLGKQNLSSHPEAILALTEVLLYDFNIHVQRESAEALGRQNLSFYEESIKALIHCLQPDISWEVRKIAAESLGKQNVKSMYDCILNTFITSLTKDKNELVRRTISESIAKILLDTSSHSIISKYKSKFSQLYAKEQDERVLKTLKYILDKIDKH